MGFLVERNTTPTKLSIRVIPRQSVAEIGPAENTFSYGLRGFSRMGFLVGANPDNNTTLNPRYSALIRS